MFRRLALAAVIVSIGVIAGPTTAPATPPTGTVSCSSHLAQSAYNQPMSVAALPGAFATTTRGLFSNCTQTGNTGDIIIGGVYSWTAHSLNGPRSCPAAASTPTYNGTSYGKITWWAIDKTTGQKHTYSSASTVLNLVTSDNNLPPTVTVRFMLTSGLFNGSTITGIGTVFQPAPLQFAFDCLNAAGVLKGSALNNGTVTVP